ncbi:MAG TPA: oxygenase MpaB family protein [Chloroflexia bacterium]|nr:oxygenase MpaB family protein [Chloroflexia bacterium]
MSITLAIQSSATKVEKIIEQSYQEHNWLKFFRWTARYNQAQYEMPLPQALQAARYYTQYARQRLKSEIDSVGSRGLLVKYYRLVRRYTGLNFDPTLAAIKTEQVWSSTAIKPALMALPQEITVMTTPKWFRQNRDNARGRFAIRDYISQLNPVKDHQEIAFLSINYEFPFDSTCSMVLALIRTFCDPGMTGLVSQCSDLLSNSQKRLEDTALILSEILEWGLDSERGREAIRRMNRMHHRFEIPNEQYLYVLSVFILEPIRWNERFGWRKMIEQEKLACFYYMRELGRRMNIKEIPETYEELERFNLEYERNNFRYAETNRQVLDRLFDSYLSLFPRLARPLLKRFFWALLDETARQAFDLPRTSKVSRWLTHNAFRLRGQFVRFLPPRHYPRLVTQMEMLSYPQGYLISDLGTHRPTTEPVAALRASGCPFHHM